MNDSILLELARLCEEQSELIAALVEALEKERALTEEEDQDVRFTEKHYNVIMGEASAL